jgi:hypothetical protein
MPYVLIAIAAVLVFAIAAGTIGREAHRLDAVAPRAVYVIGEAVEFVADRLPEHVQARVTPAELAELLTVHVNRFHNRGLAPGDVIDRTQDIASPLFVDEIDEVAFVLGEADKRQIDVTDEDVATIIEQHLVYFDTIGAVGPRADP